MNWNNDQFGITSMIPGMMPNMLGGMVMGGPMTGSQIGGLPVGMMPEMRPPGSSQPVIGPMIPDGVETSKEKDDNSDRGPDRRDRRDNRDSRGRRHSRDRTNYYESRDRSERNDRTDKGRDRRDRRSKWDNNDQNNQQEQSAANTNSNANIPGFSNLNTQGNMLPFGNHVVGTSIEMQNMASNMSNMLMHQQNMMGANMMDPMMLMNQQLMQAVSTQPIFFRNGVLLPPLPGTSVPPRRERPDGCQTIYIGGLPNGVDEEMIQEIFMRFGVVTEVKVNTSHHGSSGFCHVRFDNSSVVDTAVCLSGYRFKYHNQSENEATTIFIDYAVNPSEQCEQERGPRRGPPRARLEPLSPAALAHVADNIKTEQHFCDAAPILTGWLERGECSRKNASTFYSLIQASNNQLRRLFNEKMLLDEELHNLKSSIRDKFAHVVMQFEQVAKILSAAKHQRVSDHFSKQQRRNIDMWLKMTEEVDNIREEYKMNFDDEDGEKHSRNVVAQEKYEELKKENENLMYELEGYKNEAHLAKDEAERKFEKFKAHFIAQQALQNTNMFPLPTTYADANKDNQSKITVTEANVSQSEAKLISVLTAFLMVHPLGVSLDYLVSYVKTMIPNIVPETVNQTLQKYGDVFCLKTSGVGASIEHKWCFKTFYLIKKEA